MNKKGFTLIEVLAVVVILGLLAVILTPTVKNLINDSEETVSKQQINTIITATKKYMVEHSELLPEMNEDSKSVVYIGELIENGVLEGDKIIDPKTKENIDGCVVIKYNNGYNQYEYEYQDGKNQNECNPIIVTFDAQGGTVDKTTKKVAENGIYGELPTPTREGYTFKGWNGKNMFDSSKLLEETSWTEENEIYSGDIRYLYQKYNPNFSGGVNIIDNFKSNTVYILSFETKNETTNGGVKFAFSYIDEGVSISQSTVTSNALEFKKYSLKSQDNESINGLYIGYNSRQNVWLKNIQLEEGSTATPFEPYYITSNTTVVQDKNHTLKAIWEKNE